MRIEKLTQYNNLNSNNSQKASQQKSYAGNGLYQIKNQFPSFGGRITNYISKLLGFREDGNLLKPRKTCTKYEYERSVVRKQIKPSNIEPPEIKPIKEEPKIEEPKIGKPVKPILPDRYALVDEYDKRTQARVKFRNKTRGRALTPAENAESDRLRLEWSEIYHRLIPEHQSIVKTKTAADFTNEADKQNYILDYVLPRMGMSEESALDALDMFEQFGFRADYPNHFDSTISKLSDGIYTIPKECRSDKLLNRFIEVFGKFADNKPHYHPDDDGLAAVLTSFVEKRDDIQESTVLKAIELMKKIISQKANYERLERTLVSAYDAKYKNSEPIKKALEELKVISKDMQYRLGADDK